MKKKSKIKIINDKKEKNKNNYTFLNDFYDDFSFQSTDIQTKNKEIDDYNNKLKSDKSMEKRKSILSKKDMSKSSKGLKFVGQSQRNHSSVYE